MLNKPFFSIIVPVYNVENYLAECLNSILAQTWKDWEVILVNDGSTDKCGVICRSYAERDFRIKLIEKENGGLSDARNAGIESAGGRYLVFVDSDDYILPNAMEEFSRFLSDCSVDVLATQLCHETQNGERSQDINVAVLPWGAQKKKDQILEFLYGQSDTALPAQRYIVNRDYIEKKQFRFIKGYLHEDIHWVTRLHIYADTMAYCSIVWYIYRVGRPGSITSEKTAKKIMDIFELTKLVVDEVNNISVLNQSLKIKMRKQLCARPFVVLKHFNCLDKEEKKIVFKIFKNNRTYLAHSSALRHRLFLLLERILGLRVALWITGLIS